MGEHDRYSRRPPKGMCELHYRHWMGWRNYNYSWQSPREWGGGHIMDSRTSHQTRAEGWDRKNQEQMDFCEQFCLSGRSNQCQGERYN